MKQIMYIQFDRLFPNLFPIPGISVPFGARADLKVAWASSLLSTSKAAVTPFNSWHWELELSMML